MPEQIIYWHAFALIPEIGPKTFTRIQEFFQNDLEQAWKTLRTTTSPNLISEKHLEVIRRKMRLIDPEQAWNNQNKQETKFIIIENDAYPSWLKEIHSAPFALFVRGELPKRFSPLVTIVGTRAKTSYGQDILEYLIPSLVKKGIGIVSGLAYGIDSVSHQVTLRHGGYTAAVLGSSVDLITPRGNQRLAEEIIESGGGVISELPPNTPIFKGSFPRRNRILAGISPLTIVIEAAEKSGSLITANYALENNREVATIPGSIFSEQSIGCHKLLKQGAKLIQSIDDILEYFEMTIDDEAQPYDLDITDEQMLVYQCLSEKPKPLDRLREELEFSSAELLAILTELEMKRAIRNEYGRGYRKRAF